MAWKVRKLGLIGLLLVLISSADSIQNDGPVLSIIVNGTPTATSRDFLIQNSGIVYLFANELFPALGAKPDYSPDLSVFYLNSKGLKIAANLKTNQVVFAGEEMKFSGGFWRDSKLYISEDFITDVYARARGWDISIDKPESVKNYQSAFRLPDKIKRDPVKVIVIDPGHGGESIGASSSDGFREKDLTLAIALKLKNKLKSVPGLKVYLTREEDREVYLDDRPEFANKFNADLFLSIHANACDAESASGFETYFMSFNASDEDSRKIALWENLDLSGEQKNHSQELSPENLSELDMILGDMAQSEHLAESEVFAKIIQTNLGMIMKNPNRGVKQAPFRVLMGANMPAALVEVGFITNAKDRRNLLDEKNQDRIVSILAGSILDFRELKSKRLGLTEVNAKPKPQNGPAKTSVNQNRAAQIR